MSVPLEAKVAALRQPRAYPQGPASVEVIETHMSWVFLTPERVYKLKKPMRADGLDFGTVERRRFFCAEELRLNRRLAPAVYLDVEPLAQGADGSLHVAGAGRVVDWLVVMRRLASDVMLDRLLARHAATSEHLGRVAGLLAGFYGTLTPALRDPQVYRRRLRAEIDAHEARLCDLAFTLDGVRVRPLCDALRSFLERRRDLLAARVREGRIVEGHGDLRPEHVWLGTPPAVIDCLEFSPELRTVDSADELGFLALECERAGEPGLGAALLERAAAASGDAPPPELIAFYQALRGCVRAGIALWHLKEPRYRGQPVWRERALRYLELAAVRARQLAA